MYLISAARCQASTPRQWPPLDRPYDDLDGSKFVTLTALPDFNQAGCQLNEGEQ